MKPLRICIDARLSGGHGGVEQMIIGLAGAFSRLDDTTEEYLFLVTPGKGDWLRPHLAGPCRILESGSPPPRRGLGSRIAWQLQAGIPWLPRRRWPPPTDGFNPEQLEVLGRSDGTIEAAGVDLIHFSLTLGFLTAVPSIYQPHDLQHLHFPEFFAPNEIERRELTYRTFSARAGLVVLMTSWGKEDVVRHYGLPPEKVAVIPSGSVLSNYPVPSDTDLAEVRRGLDLPDRFILFPAQTWPHKNHLTLVEALALLRDRHDLEVTAICPGKQTDHLAEIEARAADLGLSGAVRFPGYVTPLELRSLYTLATALVFPSLFEGWGLPITEAMSIGVPVACSDIPSLRDVARDAALTFDPRNPEQIADRVTDLWKDEALRRSLAERGERRSDQLTFDHSARLLRAHYRRMAGRSITQEDRELLDAPPLT